MNDIAFVILNKRYEDPAIVSLTSFFTYNRTEVLAVLERGGDYSRIKQALNGYPCSFIEADFPQEQIFQQVGGRHLLISRESLPAISQRIVCLEELAERYDRILNFDLDSLFLNSIAKVLNVADNAHVYGVDEKKNRLQWLEAFQLQEWVPGTRYFNTGFAVYGGALLRGRNLYKDYVAAMEDHPERFNCPEQDYLNYLFHNEFVPIRASYNLMFKDPLYTSLAPVMVHFYGPDKPWSRNAEFYGMNGFYNRRYANSVTRCEGYLSQDFVTAVRNNTGKDGVLE